MRSLRRLPVLVALPCLLIASPALANRLIAVLPLDVTNTDGKMDKAAEASLEEALRDVTTQALRPSGWTILSGETMLQVLTDNGIDTAQCGMESCQLQAAREIKVDKFISGSVQYVDGEFTASIRLIDTRTGQILSSASLTGHDALELRGKFKAKSADFFSEAEVAGSAPVAEETTGELFLQADPPDATFQIDNGAPTGLIPGRNTVLTLPLGAHHLVLRKQGLQDYQKDVFIQAGKPATIRATLLAPPPPSDAAGQAYLTVDSQPQQARIFLDGRDTGKVTPANFSGLAAGEHQIVLQRDLYLDWQERVMLKADDVKLVKPDLRSNFGTLNILTDPPGATVYVDGSQEPGVTPLELNHSEARAFRVRITLPRYDSVETTVVVQPGETTSVKESLKPQFGTLVLRPKPDGVTVYLDGTQLTQRTPTTRERLAARTYRLRLTAPGYRDLERTVRIEAGKTAVVDDALIPTTGALVVTAEVNGQPFSGAEVYVQGEKQGETPFSGPVPEGEVDVEVRAPLHRSYTAKVVMVAQQQVAVHATLVPEYGFVRVSSTPGGTFTVDGAAQGPADGTTYKVRMGSHHLTVTPDDPVKYRPYEEDAVVELGKTQSIAANLVARVGSLVVQTMPPGVAITLDGESRGTSPQRLAGIFAGNHTLKLQLEKYVDWTHGVVVEEGKTAAVDVTLTSVNLVKYEEHQRARQLRRATVAWVVTGVLAVTSGASLLAAHVYSGDESSDLQSYNSATTTNAIAAYRLNATAAYSSAQASQIVSVATGVAALGALAWAITEMATLPPAARAAEPAAQQGAQ